MKKPQKKPEKEVSNSALSNDKGEEGDSGPAAETLGGEEAAPTTKRKRSRKHKPRAKEQPQEVADGTDGEE